MYITIQIATAIILLPDGILVTHINSFVAIYKNDKKLKIKKVSRDCATKSKETRIRFWDKRTFWA